MAAVQKVCVIGGGFSGMAAAIQMRRAGLEVDLYEIDAQWCPLGAGITINGPTLRALESLGLYGEFQQRGCVTSGLDICAPHGMVVAQLPTPSPVGSSVGGGGGIMRPALAAMMAEATRAAGVNVHLGNT
jgi:2-polyprenyl-6-methoxyphenol hydroxylase-like FAD-dependent oxidoreductase